MDTTEIKMVPGRPNRGTFPVTLTIGDKVLLAGKVNPHDSKSITAFLQKACRQLPGLKARRDDLRQELLNLAKPKEAAGPLPPRPPEEHPYRECLGGVFWMKPMGDTDIPVPLMNFTARITADVMRDDGAERETAFQIEAAQGGRTQTFAIPATRFNAMNWPTEHLGAQAIVYPGQSIRDHARAAIQFLSPRPIPRQTIFTHTGWRKLDGGNGGNAGYAYLHGGGAIGSAGQIDGIQVDLPAGLLLYKLPNPPQGDELRSAVRASMKILTVAADPIAIPPFCAIYRAALGPCDFGMHLGGPTGAFKTEEAALVQQHFGSAMDSRNLPGSWHSTDNALEGLLFAAKDAVTVVDDFAPGGGPHDVARWHQRADRIIRAQGNNAGRGRMRADGTLRPPKPPRGLVLSTGEEIPKGQSLRARALILEISRGDIEPKVLTPCQEDARAGLYAAAMAGFIRFLAGRYEEVRRGLRAEMETLRQQATSGDSHCRTPEIVANLALGLRYFIAFAQNVGVLTEAEGRDLWQRGWAALMQAGNRQAAHQAASEPAGRFIDLLTSALASGQAHLAGADGNVPANAAAWGWRQVTIGTGSYARGDWQPQGARIGWLDGGDALLDPDASYKAAQNMAGTNGDGLTISARTLRKRMDEKEMVIRPGDRDELLSRRVVEGRKRRVLHLAGGVLSAEPAIPTISTSGPVGEAASGDW